MKGLNKKVWRKWKSFFYFTFFIFHLLDIKIFFHYIRKKKVFYNFINKKNFFFYFFKFILFFSKIFFFNFSFFSFFLSKLFFITKSFFSFIFSFHHIQTFFLFYQKNLYINIDFLFKKKKPKGFTFQVMNYFSYHLLDWSQVFILPPYIWRWVLLRLTTV